MAGKKSRSSGKKKQRSLAARFRKGKKRKYTRPQPFELKLKAVKLYLEEKYPAELVAQEVGIVPGTVFDWVRQYREHGEEGLRPKRPGHRRTNISPVVKGQIAAAKKKHPSFGIKRISQFLKRTRCVQASPETVRKTLKEANLATKPTKKRRRKRKPKVRFFERSKPNQLWQSDITTFPVKGRSAYLIGFMDDFSRYIVSLKVSRSQRAGDVIDAYRTAAGDYGLPREVLTDNGRQYVSWRGRSSFQKELTKDDVRHIRSATHHPQTLGKLERFWKSIKDELLSRATFETFEECQQRVALWVKYYNHRRPHQGIDGACPADRFFMIQQPLREVMERGIEENIQELAVHGKVKDPFYMVGRMGTKSVTISTENGEVKVSVDEDAEGEQSDDSSEEEAERRNSEATAGGPEDVQCAGEAGGGSVGVVGEAEAGGSVQGDGDQMGEPEPVAEPGPGSDVSGVRAEGAEGGGPWAGAGTEAGEAAAEEAAPERREPIEGGSPAAGGAGECGKAQEIGEFRTGKALLKSDEVPIVRQILRELEECRGARDESSGIERTKAAGAGMGAGDPGREEREADCDRSSKETGGITSDVLQAGDPCVSRDDGRTEGQACGSAEAEEGYGEREAEATAGGYASGDRGAEADLEDQGDAAAGEGDGTEGAEEAETSQEESTAGPAAAGQCGKEVETGGAGDTAGRLGKKRVNALSS